MNIVLETWPVALTALITTFLSIRLLRPIALKTNLVDVPDERKQHQGHIPLTGGLSIFAGLIIGALTISLFLPASTTNENMAILLATAAIILVMGLVDDYRKLGAIPRILIQCIACLIMMLYTGIHVKTLGNIAGLGEVTLGIWGVPFTLLAVVGFINALNMTDGIDGLTGGLVLTAILAIFTFQMATGFYAHADKLLLLAVVMIPYMISNLGLFGMNKIFLGDAGSMLMGYLIGWTIIILTQPAQPSIEPVFALWCVAIPLLDMWAVMFKRMRRGLSAFTSDRGHLHHLFISHGVGDRRALILILVFAISIVMIGLLVSMLFPDSGFWAFLVVMVFYTTANQYFDGRQPEQPTPGAESTDSE